MVSHSSTKTARESETEMFITHRFWWNYRVCLRGPHREGGQGRMQEDPELQDPGLLPSLWCAGGVLWGFFPELRPDWSTQTSNWAFVSFIGTLS